MPRRHQLPELSNAFQTEGSWEALLTQLIAGAPYRTIHVLLPEVFASVARAAGNRLIAKEEADLLLRNMAAALVEHELQDVLGGFAPRPSYAWGRRKFCAIGMTPGAWGDG